MRIQLECRNYQPSRDEICLVGELGIFSWGPLALAYAESMLSHRTDLNINAKQPWLNEMSKSHFFLGYVEYFQPKQVQCLNKLWHWAILTLFSNHWLHIDVPCVRRRGFPLNTPWPDSSTGEQKNPFWGGARQFWSGGNQTVEKEMKNVEDLNRTLVNLRPNRVKNTTQSTSVKCLANYVMSDWDETNFE